MTNFEYHKTRHIKNLPDPPPRPTHLPETAELTGRYSVGSHNSFRALSETQMLSELIAIP
jgi:hypothetical protein